MMYKVQGFMLFVYDEHVYCFFERSMNMGTLLNVQLSVFGNYHIEASVANVTRLMQKLNELGRYEYLPSIVPAQNIDFMTGRVNTTSNLSFVASSNRSQILCMDNRLDCLMNFSTEDVENWEDCVQFCESVMDIIMGEYPIVGNRLAININVLGQPIQGEVQETALGQHIVSVLDFYKEQSLNEWSTRANSRIPMEINNQSEILNVITELNLAQNNENNERRVMCHLDVNTVPEKQDFRFAKESVHAFICETKGIITDLLNNFEAMNGNE